MTVCDEADLTEAASKIEIDHLFCSLVSFKKKSVCSSCVKNVKLIDRNIGFGNMGG